MGSGSGDHPAEFRRGGKSRLHRAGRSLTATEGDLKESATETHRPERGRRPSRGVRVKSCGKSARIRQVTGGWGKPRLEQDLIGERPAYGGAKGGPPCSRVGRLSPMATSGLDRWSPPRRTSAGYRTWLTDPLPPNFSSPLVAGFSLQAGKKDKTPRKSFKENFSLRTV